MYIYTYGIEYLRLISNRIFFYFLDFGCRIFFIRFLKKKKTFHCFNISFRVSLRGQYRLLNGSSEFSLTIYKNNFFNIPSPTFLHQFSFSVSEKNCVFNYKLNILIYILPIYFYFKFLSYIQIKPMHNTRLSQVTIFLFYLHHYLLFF